ncbi:hypothetical protein V866_004435 [Kwoniella sp. B9012]
MAKSKPKAQLEAPQESTPSTLAEAQNQPGSLGTDPEQVQLSSSSSSSRPKSRSSKKKSKNIPIITPPIFSEEQIIQYHLMHPSVSQNTISPYSIDPITLSSKKRKREGESPRFSHPLPVIWFEGPSNPFSSSGKKKDKKDKQTKRIHLSTRCMQVPDHAVKSETIGNSAAFWLGDLHGSSSVSTLSTNLADSMDSNQKVEDGKEKENGNASDKVKTKSKSKEKKTVTQAQEGKVKGKDKAEVKENSNKRSEKTNIKSNGNPKSKSKDQSIPQPKPKPTVLPTTTVTPKAYEPVNLSDTSDSESESSTSSSSSSTSSSSDETDSDSDSDDESDPEPTIDPSNTSNYNSSSFDRPPPQQADPPQSTTNNNIDTPKIKTNGNAPLSTKKRVSLLDPSTPVQTLPLKQLEQLVTPTPTTVATPEPSGEKKKNKKRESTGGKGKKGPKWVTETPKVK